MNTLFQEPLAPLLARLHHEAAHQSFPNVRPGSNYQEAYQQMGECYLAVDPDLGKLLYSLVRLRKPQLVVEFGTSFGLSTLYLAAAVRDNGFGRIVGSEFIEAKARQARTNLQQAGLADLVEVRVGDALETLRGLEPDLLLLDGAKNLYLPLIQQFQLTPGAVVVADNIDMRELLGDYLDYVRNPLNGFISTTLGEAELSTYL